MENQIGRAEMYEKLRWWSKSLTAYQYQRRKEPNNTANIVGEMTSMEALGDFPNVLRSFNALTSKRAVASTAALGARAAWLLQSWDDMAIAADLMPKDGYFATTSSFYKAVLAVHNGSKDCQDNIDECRRKLDGQLSGLIAESYGRAYRLIVGLQQLSELEEIFAVKKDPSLLPKFSCLWEKRLLRMCPDPVEWQGVLVNHSIVTTPQSQLSMWIQFVSLCRANGREIIAKEVLKKLLGGYTVQEVIKNHHHTKNPSIVIAALSHMYEMGEKNEALGLLRSYTTKLESISSENALCHQKLGLWLSTANTAYAECEYERDIILDHLRKATEIDPSNGHMWHQWARANHDIVDAIGTGDKSIENYIVCAVQGYVNSIRYLKQLQDVLGFLSLWFSYGGQQEVNVVVVKGIETINVNVWLSVIPQIIARIHTSSRLVNESVQTLLAYIAKCHPQALLYTLNVNDNVHGAAAKVTSDMINRRDSGQLVLDRVVEMHGSRLVNEARMVCQELNRSAVLWSEIWLEEILRANNQWVQDGDIRKVWNTLEPLLVLFDKPNKTPSEETFTVEFGTLLKDSTILLFEALQGSKEMNDAWSRLNTVCKQLERQIKNTTSLVMEFVSPKLVESGRDLSLVVPGQYSGAPVFPRIACFVHDMKVMSSKQHPRRISIIGNDGVQYKFLLKGHEDLRQDERVMQLLGLVNTFLESHRATKGHDCTAKLFSVTPLAENAGLVGWVDNCDTLHAIIEGYRAINGIPISTELSKIKSMTDDHSRLIVVQQQECFEASQEDTDGMDIARHCWCHAPGAEVWLDRRTTYVRTLASMSIVGHILGLGDRHPLNLIMHASTGRVVHIDFGDCFEVAMARSIFPEKVPFRLTRMLVKAMEISGIDGLFRHGCENVMQVLREEQNSVLAMLEAFVHDPLISWRLSEEGHEELYNEGKCHRDTERPGMEAGRSFVQKKDVLVGSVRSVTNISRVVKSLKFDGVDRQLHSYKKARRVIDRVREKLNGKEFMSQQEWPPNGGPLTIPDQVSRLIEEATSSGNLCQHFQGWCAFW